MRRASNGPNVAEFLRISNSSPWRCFFLTLLGRRLRHAEKNVDRRRSLVADDVIQTGLFNGGRGFTFPRHFRRRSLVADDVIQTGLFNGGRGVTFPSFAFFSWFFLCVCVCAKSRSQSTPSVGACVSYFRRCFGSRTRKLNHFFLRVCVFGLILAGAFRFWKPTTADHLETETGSTRRTGGGGGGG